MPSVKWSEVLNNAKEAGPAKFEPLPPGDYTVEVVNAEYKTSSNGKPMFKVEFDVVSGPYKGRKVWTQLVISYDNPNAQAITLSKFNALGIPTDFFASDPEDEEVCAALLGKQATVSIKHREYNNQIQNEVARIKASTTAPASVSAPKPSAPRTSAPNLPPGL